MVRDPMTGLGSDSISYSLSQKMLQLGDKNKHRGDEREREREERIPVYEDDKSLSDFSNEQKCKANIV